MNVNWSQHMLTVSCTLMQGEFEVLGDSFAVLTDNVKPSVRP